MCAFSICCSVGSGSYNVYMDNELIILGGTFGSTETVSFGECHDVDPGPSAAFASPQSLSGVPKLQEKPFIDCIKLDSTRCTAADDICEWRKAKTTDGNFNLDMNGLQKKSCHFLE